MTTPMHSPEPHAPDMWPRFSIHREGWPFIAAFAVGAAILFALWEPLGWIGAIATIWCVYFFRDPVRVTPQRQGLAISAADGMVHSVVDIVPPAETGLQQEPHWRISVFLNVFDVHVNRFPIAGRIVAKSYVAGKFLNAASEKASADNERLIIRAVDAQEQAFAVVQIAGLVARRIVHWVAEGQTLSAGERFGLIRFGSRVDHYLPKSYTPLVMVGQRAIAGETVLADTETQEALRTGVTA